MKTETKITCKNYEIKTINTNGINFKTTEINKIYYCVILNENTVMKIEKKEEKIVIYLSGTYEILLKKVKKQTNKGHIYFSQEYWGEKCLLIPL